MPSLENQREKKKKGNVGRKKKKRKKEKKATSQRNCLGEEKKIKVTWRSLFARVYEYFCQLKKIFLIDTKRKHINSNQTFSEFFFFYFF